jgi:hypothetical protein
MLPDFQRWRLHGSTEQIQPCNIDTSITPTISSNIKIYYVDISNRHVIECDSVKLTAPLFWILRDSSGNEMVKNGSLFFLNAGEGAFAVRLAVAGLPKLERVHPEALISNRYES